jgi:DNA-binding MarR family transcriptional regulator
MVPRFLPKDLTAGKAGKIGMIIDHLVDALGGEPSSTLRRAIVLADIDQHPGTSQTEVLKRINIDKSALNRDIDWLFDQGCIYREQGSGDGRTVSLKTIGYSKNNLALALEFFNNDHESLKKFLRSYICLFEEFDIKPALRDAKIVAKVAENRKSSRREILKELYGGPASTDTRAIASLLETGLLRKSTDGS